ncbi:MAG: hypothetical protein HQL69_12270 [Magnetococcales bacterium]|nr:hypothetical protein [Magnetococcales bacterium]
MKIQIKTLAASAAFTTMLAGCQTISAVQHTLSTNCYEQIVTERNLETRTAMAEACAMKDYLPEDERIKANLVALHGAFVMGNSSKFQAAIKRFRPDDKAIGPDGTDYVDAFRALGQMKAYKGFSAQAKEIIRAGSKFNF